MPRPDLGVRQMREDSLGLVSKADGHSIVRIHEPDRDGQIDQLLLVEYCAC